MHYSKLDLQVLKVSNSNRNISCYRLSSSGKTNTHIAFKPLKWLVRYKKPILLNLELLTKKLHLPFLIALFIPGEENELISMVDSTSFTVSSFGIHIKAYVVYRPQALVPMPNICTLGPHK